MQEAKRQKKRRQRRCRNCRDLFMPDPRSKDNQKYCSKRECQRKRQRQNEKAWRKRNPDCLAYQKELSREWHKSRPEYSRQRRNNTPALLRKNRIQTRLRMRNMRAKRVFDKSKVILTQLVGNKRVKCYLTKGAKWAYVRLTKASPLSKPIKMSNNRKRYKEVANHLPRGRLYEIPNILE